MALKRNGTRRPNTTRKPVDTTTVWEITFTDPDNFGSEILRAKVTGQAQLQDLLRNRIVGKARIVTSRKVEQ